MLCLILLAVAGVFVTSKLGLVNYQKMLSTIPLVNNIMTQPSAGSMAASYAALKQENESLKMQVQTLQEEVAQSQGSQASSAGAVTSTGDGGRCYRPTLRGAIPWMIRRSKKYTRIWRTTTPT